MVLDSLAAIVGPPVVLEELKHRPGRRQTLRARGSRATAIVKLYVSDRAPAVALRVAALAGGPPEPIVPSVLHVDAALRMLVLSDLPGVPLREAILAGDTQACLRAGAALGSWHASWLGARPEGLAPHTIERELAILRQRMAATTPAIGQAVEAALPGLSIAWSCRTVVHRDLYEEQILVGDRIGIIDVDDAALGPPELDVGNLVAHLELLGRRRDLDPAAATGAILDGYARGGPTLDDALLARCRALALLRLACLNSDEGLVEAALGDRAVA